MLWLDSIYNTKSDKQLPYILYHLSSGRTEFVFTLYDDETDRYIEVDSKGLLPYLKQNCVIGATHFKMGAVSEGFTGYAYDAVDRKICQLLDFGEVSDKYDCSDMNVLVQGRDGVDTIKIYYRGTKTEFGVESGTRILRLSNSCTLSCFLRYSLKYGSKHTIWYDNNRIVFCLGLNNSNMWLEYKVLDRRLFEVLAKSKLMNGGSI